MTFPESGTAGTRERVPAPVLALAGLWLVLQIWLYPVTVARYFPLLVDFLQEPTRIFAPAYVFPVENFLLWGMLRALKIRTLSALMVFHFSVLFLLATVLFLALTREASGSWNRKGGLLFLISPFAFTAGVLHLPNNEGLLFLLMVSAWAVRHTGTRAGLGLLLGWTHYPTAFLGWLAWMIARRKRPGLSEGTLLAGILLGWLTLRIYLAWLGVPPDSIVQFLPCGQIKLFYGGWQPFLYGYGACWGRSGFSSPACLKSDKRA